MASTNEATTTTSVSALRAELSTSDGPVLLDVRTPGEFEAARIDGAVNLPLDQVEAHITRIADHTDGPIVVICQSGGRATRAARALADAGLADITVLDGGMNAWSTAGAPVQSSGPTTWALERQVRLVAGGIVATSIIGSVWAPKLRFLAGGIGAGLVFAALSNTCAMGAALMKLPYNRTPNTDIDVVVKQLLR